MGITHFSQKENCYQSTTTCNIIQHWSFTLVHLFLSGLWGLSPGTVILNKLWGIQTDKLTLCLHLFMVQMIPLQTLTYSHPHPLSQPLRCQGWPLSLPLHSFTYVVDMQLRPSPKLKSNNLGALTLEIIKYTPYPLSAQLDDVAEALIIKHPCLKEQGCFWILQLENQLEASPTWKTER